MKPFVYLALSAVLSFGSAWASDLEREQRLEAQIIDVIFDGEPIHLDAAGHRFLALHMETDAEQPKGAVILLHGRGYHPDWENVVRPLRIGLPAHGWHTLSLQLPVLAKEAKYYDYVSIFPEAFPRIEAGIQYLKEQGVERIVMVAHSCGAHMAMAWVDANGGAGIDAYVGIGMGATDYQQPMKKPFPLDRMKVPVLDVYGAEEFPAVHRLAPERLLMIERAGNPKSLQVVVPGADHYFRDKGEPLLETVAGWLETLTH